MTDTNKTTAADETLARITELARQALQSQASLAKQSLELGRATLVRRRGPVLVESCLPRRRQSRGGALLA